MQGKEERNNQVGAIAATLYNEDGWPATGMKSPVAHLLKCV